jgi:hypothetical protein
MNLYVVVQNIASLRKKGKYCLRKGWGALTVRCPAKKVGV